MTGDLPPAPPGAAPGRGKGTGPKGRLGGLRRTAVRVAISVGLLAWVLSRIPLRSVVDRVLAADRGWLLAALALHPIGLLVSSIRWGELLAARGERVPLGRLLASYLVGSFFNTFLPTGFGGDVMRAHDTRAAARGFGRSAAIVLVERGTGILAVFLLGSVTVLAGGWFALAPWISAAVVAGALGGCAVVVFGLALGPRLTAWRPPGRPAFAGRVWARAVGFLETLVAYRGEPGLLVVVMLLGIVLQLNVVLHHAFIGRALGLDVSVGYYFLVVPVMTAALLAPTINGAGMREAVFLAALGAQGVDEAGAVALGLVALGLQLAFALVGGVVYAVRRPDDVAPAAGAAAGGG